MDRVLVAHDDLLAPVFVRCKQQIVVAAWMRYFAAHRGFLALNMSFLINAIV